MKRSSNLDHAAGFQQETSGNSPFAFIQESELPPPAKKRAKKEKHKDGKKKGNGKENSNNENEETET